MGEGTWFLLIIFAVAAYQLHDWRKKKNRRSNSGEFEIDHSSHRSSEKTHGRDDVCGSDTGGDSADGGGGGD